MLKRNFIEFQLLDFPQMHRLFRLLFRLFLHQVFEVDERGFRFPVGKNNIPYFLQGSKNKK